MLLDYLAALQLIRWSGRVTNFLASQGGNIFDAFESRWLRLHTKNTMSDIVLKQ